MSEKYSANNNKSMTAAQPPLLELPRFIGAFRNRAVGGYVAHATRAQSKRSPGRYDKPGISVYDCPNPLLPDAKARDLGTIAEQGEVWADIDSRDLLTPRDEVLKTLLDLPLPIEIRDSGGGGFHSGLLLKECDARDTPEFERVNRVRTQWIHLLCADVSQDHHAHLLRRLGTHNSNYDPSGECRVIRAGKRIDITEAETLFELYPSPLFERDPAAKESRKAKGKASGANGHAAVIDDAVEAESDPDKLLALLAPGNVNQVVRRVIPNCIVAWLAP